MAEADADTALVERFFDEYVAVGMQERYGMSPSQAAVLKDSFVASAMTNQGYVDALRVYYLIK